MDCFCVATSVLNSAGSDVRFWEWALGAAMTEKGRKAANTSSSLAGPYVPHEFGIGDPSPKRSRYFQDLIAIGRRIILAPGD
jgi:hypothetical protein